MPLAQAIALAFIAPLIALYPRRRHARRDRSAKRTIAASLIAFAGVVDHLRRPGAGRPRPRRAARQHRHPRLGGLLRGQHHPHAPPGAGRRPIEIAFFQNLTVVGAAARRAARSLGDAACPPATIGRGCCSPPSCRPTSLLLLVLGLCPRRGELSRRDRIYVASCGRRCSAGWSSASRVAVHAGRRGADRRRLHLSPRARPPKRSPALEAAA